jgi:hypothetical protein
MKTGSTKTTTTKTTATDSKPGRSKLTAHSTGKAGAKAALNPGKNAPTGKENGAKSVDGQAVDGRSLAPKPGAKPTKAVRAKKGGTAKRRS